ncbi:hypothetical protein NCCP1664_25030 [Zafaria cholistanensis]|uniref:Uncharacterized protein n=1 Tax=Zafaria cholistanensis TaxID=1682741 RepID=A0A5A7NVB9_9MICC|nr:hypothetical protein NCCP1664_25030 [Zafaria cholistanensis]
MLLVLEGLAVLAAAAWYLLSIGQEGPVNMGGRLFMLFLLLAAGAWQFLVGHFLFRGKAWTRASALAWQVFQVIFAASFFGGGMPLVALGLLVPAAAILLLLFDPKATAFFGDRGASASRGAQQ